MTPAELIPYLMLRVKDGIYQSYIERSVTNDDRLRLDNYGFKVISECSTGFIVLYKK